MSEHAEVLRITILCDNRALPGFGSEHGWAALVESAGHRVLLDTGSGPTLLPNARQAGADLSTLDALVLSHGHYDHTGGLAALLEQSGPLDVWAHPAAFEPTFASGAEGDARYIGMPLARSEYEALGARFRLCHEPVEVAPGVRTTGFVPRSVTGSVPAPHLLRTRDDLTGPDDFVDDMSLVLSAGEGVFILTGCAHAGLRNILARAWEIAPGAPVWAIAGGTHLVAAPGDEVRELARDLAAAGVSAIGAAHCTGEASAQAMREAFSGRTLDIAAGLVLSVAANGLIRTS
ncbi:MAG: MBL fold metallo-hydrolase [Armatimonadetes bacterium]|jgi:7,8-dihydropterin-6-yl-methyl-4-(beta-D-ribofuranosyl)aminobenzene 5'-phosphate synthase|nr:MBL fold metallo-hydrolase [Armatimonadota bacterium]MDI9587130.1 MBL fold metallo-hydrolase [Acidobacteriota bacterium]